MMRVRRGFTGLRSSSDRRRLRGANADGLTLVELLVAMSIFSVLGLFIFTLLRGSLNIYQQARSTGELFDKFDNTVSRLADDLTCVTVGDPSGSGAKVKFLSTWEREWVAPEGVKPTERALRDQARAAGDSRRFLLRFVRTFPGGELENTVGRFAGTYAGGEAWIDGLGDLAESRAPSRAEPSDVAETNAEDQRPGLRAPNNMAEVMYFLESGPDDIPGTATLFRATRSPVGGTGSFFLQSTIEAMSPEWIDSFAEPVSTGIAYFAVIFWGQETTEWETTRVLDGQGLRSSNAGASGLGELVWDSTRGTVTRFGLFRGTGSATIFDDDVFPRRARIVMTVVEESVDGADARLVGGAASRTRTIQVTKPELFEDGGARFLRVDNEWMEVESVTGRTLRVRRGARRTAVSNHDGGAPVLVGRTFEREIEIPAWRSFFAGGAVR